MPAMPTSRRHSYSPPPRRDMALALTMVCYCTWISEPAVITASLVSLGRCALMRQVFNVKLLSGEGLLMREHVCFGAAAELPWRLTEGRHLGLAAGGGLASVMPLPRGQVPSARGAEVNSHWDGAGGCVRDLAFICLMGMRGFCLKTCRRIWDDGIT